MVQHQIRGAAAWLTIDDEARRNPLSADVVRDLLAGVRRAAGDEAVRAVVITGAGDKAFSAGADLTGFFDSPLTTHGERGALADLFRALRRCGKPTVARVNGHALAGGFGLAAACDIVIAVDSATFGTTEIRVGLWPMMISAVLQRLVPRRIALELMLTGRRIDAAEAERIGVVSRVVAADQLDAAVDAVVAEVAATSPAAVALGKASFYAVEDLAFDAALDHLQTGITAVALTEDAPEGIAAFREKRPPQWKGR